MSDEPWTAEQDLLFRNSISECIRQNQLRILITGFEPFGGALRNPSGDVARALDGQTVQGGIIAGRILPVLWDKAPRLLEQWVEEIQPHVAVALGMARDSIEIELLATNRRHPERRDNAGALPNPARPVATKTIGTALPVDKIIQSVVDDDSIRQSKDTGAFLCEEVFFALQSTRMQVLKAQRWPFLRSGFVHVPNDRHIADEPSRARLQRIVVQIVEATIADLVSGEIS